MEYALMANKLCKNIMNWERLLLISSKLLIKLKKFDDLAGFAHKIYEVLVELTGNEISGSEEKQMFESEMINMKDAIVMIELIDLNLRFVESTQ